MNNLYLYGIIPSQQTENFGAIGLDDQEVYTIPVQNLAAVVSAYDLQGKEQVTSSRKNLKAHQSVSEVILKKYTLLPFKFGSLSSEASLQKLLTEHQAAFQQSLQKIQGKVEFGLKGIWKDMPQVFRSIAETPQIKALKDRLEQNPAEQTQNALIEIGQLVETTLQARKEALTQAIVEQLQSELEDIQVNPTLTESMFLNISILIPREQEAQLDQLIEAVGNQYEEEANFKYVGPFAPFNFIAPELKSDEGE